MQYVSKVEVLEPASSFDLATLEIVKGYLNITDDLNDDRINGLITFASSVIANICDRVFGLEKVTEYVTVTGTDHGLVLSRYPLIGIDSISKDGSPLTDYEVIDAAGGILHGAFAGSNIITYKAGYELPEEAPGPLSMAVIDVIRSTYYTGGRDPSVQSISDNASGSIRYFPPPGMSRSGAPTKAGALSPSASALIAPYKRPALA